MRFLVTGSDGLIGSQVVNDLISLHTVYSCYHELQPKQGIPIKLDLIDSDNIKKTIEEFKVDTIIHLAAMTDVDLCEKKPELAYAINSEATEILARHAANIGAFFLYVSTDYVFDGKKAMKKETDTPNPLGIYGKSKLEGEKRIQNIESNWCIARTSTPFGLHEKKKSFPLWVLENLQKNKEIDVLIDQFTSPTYVPNLSRMLIEIAVKKICGLFHTSGATRISRYELAELIAKKKNLDKKLLKPISSHEIKSWVAKRPYDSSLDVTKISSMINEKPMIIQQAIDLFLNNINLT